MPSQTPLWFMSSQYTGWLDWLTRVLSASAPPSAKVKDVYGAWDPNSGPHADMAGALPTEPSFRPLCCILNIPRNNNRLRKTMLLFKPFPKPTSVPPPPMITWLSLLLLPLTYK